MPHYTGKNLYAAFGGTVLSGDQRSIGWEYSTDTVDTSAGADTDRSYLATLKDATISGSFLDNGTAGSAMRQALKVGASGTLEIAPEGTAATKPKYQCLAIVTSLGTEYPFDGEVMLDVRWQKTGAWTAHYEDLNSVY